MEISLSKKRDEEYERITQTFNLKIMEISLRKKMDEEYERIDQTFKQFRIKLMECETLIKRELGEFYIKICSNSLIQSISVEDFEDLVKMSQRSGLDPFTHAVIPSFEGSYFNDVSMKDLEQDKVGLKTGVKPSDDIQMNLRKKARPGEVAIIDVQSSNKMVPNLASKMKVKITEINGNSGKVPFEILRGETGDQTEIQVQVGRTGKYLVDVMLYREQLGNSPIIIEVAEEQEVSIKDTCKDSRSRSTALRRSLLLLKEREKEREKEKEKEKSPERSLIKFTDLVSKGMVIKKVKMKIESSRSNKVPAKTGLDGAIGQCVLDMDRIAVASTGEDKVKIFAKNGKFVQLLQPEVPFKRPSDMLRLEGEEMFAVRDNRAIQFFRLSGEYQYHSALESPYIIKCFGLAQDSQGLLMTINENKYLGRRKNTAQMVDPDLVTKPGGVDLLFFNWKSGQLVRKFSLTDHQLVLTADIGKSKCRFLHQDQGTIIVADNGLNKLYIITGNETIFKVVEGSGKDSFDDPGGVVTDGQGNILMADSKKHRLCVINQEGEMVGQLRLRPEVKRPSGLLYDRNTGDLFVLNLHGNPALVNYSLARK